MASVVNYKKVDNTELLDLDDATGLKIGASGSGVVELRQYSVSLNPASVAANTVAEQTFTVTGLQVGDTVISINKPTTSAGLGISGMRVSAANTLAVAFNNNTAGAIDAGAETYKIVVARFG